jgi:hypothetical protein
LVIDEFILGLRIVFLELIEEFQRQVVRDLTDDPRANEEIIETGAGPRSGFRRIIVAVIVTSGQAERVLVEAPVTV